MLTKQLDRGVVAVVPKQAHLTSCHPPPTVKASTGIATQQCLFTFVICSVLLLLTIHLIDQYEVEEEHPVDKASP